MKNVSIYIAKFVLPGGDTCSCEGTLEEILVFSQRLKDSLPDTLSLSQELTKSLVESCDVINELIFEKGCSFNLDIKYPLVQL